MRLRFAAVLIAGALAARADGRAVVVHVASTSCTSATLRATNDADVAIERRWEGGDVSFDLGDGAWTITASAPHCWAAPAAPAAPAAADGGTVNVTLWPAATLHFRIEEPRGATARVRLASTDGKISPVTIDCSGTCSIPATVLDLRIAADGFVPHYVWEKTAAPRARLDLGSIRLTRGASVSGRVTIPRKDAKLDDITVQLTPAALASRTADPQRALLTQTVKTNRRGFFQFAGVSEGSYAVIAHSKGWSAARAEDVRVIEGAEVALPKPIALTPLATLEISINPPRDPGGKPWHVRIASYPAAPAAPIDSVASAAGEWQRPQIEAGMYDLSIHDAAGSMLHHELVDVRDAMPPLRIAIESFPVRGRVTFRGEPLECGIWLTHPRNASASIRLRSDKDGKFETVLSEEGRWRVQLALAKGHAQLPDVDIRRRADGVPVDLVLVVPGGRIRGTTVDENGALVPASIAVLRNGSYAASISSDDGRFELIGIEPADVVIHARNAEQDRDGGLVPVHVTEAADEPVTIPLPKRKKAKAWLATADRQPIAGALVRYLSAGSIKEEVSGPGGELALSLPQSETAVPLVILPPGLPRKIMLLTTGAEATEIVVAPIAARLLLQNPVKTYWVAHDGAIFNGGFLFEPSYGRGRRETTSGGYLLDLEPGAYAICSTKSRERCKTVVLQAGTTTAIDLQEIFR